MAPMVSSAAEAAWFRHRVRAIQDELRIEGTPFDERVPIGVMIEVPAAGLALDHIAASADFASLGTNDLSQYWAAADRTNPLAAPLANNLEPSFLRFLDTIARGAREAKLWLGICGEMAAKALHLPLLVGLGLDEISVAPGEVLGLKSALAGLHSEHCREVLTRALAMRTADEVEALLRESAGECRAALPILDPEAIAVGVEAESKEEAILEAVNTLFVLGRTERPREVEEAVWARERTYSTGLGFGFAVPHCKTDAVAAPTLAALTLRNPIDWGSADGEPVRFVLLLAVPAADAAGAHMKVFATLARRLMHESFRQALLSAPDSGAIAEILRRELALQ
jgi:fructose-specific PTS system IIA-like component